MTAPAAVVQQPATQSGDDDVHLGCCRRPHLTLCGYPDADDDLEDHTAPTCAFCAACEHEDDTRWDAGLEVLCQIDGRPCPDAYQ